MRAFVLSALPLVAIATPALAQTTPINFDITVTDTKLIATPVVEIPDIKFDLATTNTGATESAAESQSAGELPALNAEKAESGSIISGGASVNRRYGFSDRYVQIDSPTAKAYASVNLRDLGLPHVTADAFVAHGLKTKRNRELDLGATVHDISLGGGVTGEFSVSQYVLADLHDITTFVGRMSRGPVDVSITQYLVHQEPDATKIEVGYTLTPVKSISLRPLVGFEHGFGLSDELVGGAEASYSVGQGFSVTGAVYTALYKKHGDPRGTVVDIGVSFNF